METLEQRLAARPEGTRILSGLLSGKTGVSSFSPDWLKQNAVTRSVMGRAASFSRTMEDRCPALHNRAPETIAFRNRAALSRMNNSAGSGVLTPHEEALLQRDEATHAARLIRFGDKDARPVPLYNPSVEFIRKIFMESVQKYLDQGMSYRAAWLAAKENNPSAFFTYSS
jgi:hypothetical protein